MIAVNNPTAPAPPAASSCGGSGSPKKLGGSKLCGGLRQLRGTSLSSGSCFSFRRFDGRSGGEEKGLSWMLWYDTLSVRMLYRVAPGSSLIAGPRGESLYSRPPASPYRRANEARHTKPS